MTTMRSFVLAVSLVALAGCETDLKSMAPFPCGKDKTCPGGFLCATDGCRPSGCSSGSGCAQLGSEYYCDQSQHECVSCVTSTSLCDSTGTPNCTTAGELYCCSSDFPTFCDLGTSSLSGCWGSKIQCGDLLDCSVAAGKLYYCTPPVTCAVASTTSACREVQECSKEVVLCDTSDVGHCSKDGKAHCCPTDHAAFCDPAGNSGLTGCWTTGIDCRSFTDCTKTAAAGWYWCPTVGTSCDAAATSCSKIATCSDGRSHYCTTVGKTYNCTTEKCS